MTPRGLLTTIGATALGFGIVIGGAPAIQDAFAQAATPPAGEVSAQAQQGQEIDFDAQRAATYDAFVAALASELGADGAAVDAAIRIAPSQQIDEREAAGDLETEKAAALRAVIEVSEAPLFSGFGGHGGFDGRHGRGDRDGFEGRGPRGGFDDEIGALPSDAGASDQGAPAPVMPPEDVIV